MGSEGPPQKPQLGSLKDRIAAFNQQAAQQTPPRPAPAPKPANWSWKQKQADTAVSPPVVPATNASAVREETHSPRQVDERADKKGGMSASDAKESIQKGQSLKERMAALKGQGAFGSDPIPKPPVAEKPRVWKKVVVPEQVVVAVAESSDASGLARVPSPTPRSSTEADNENDATPVPGPEEVSVEQEDDEEERERQRRAAIAVRMAKLGGARVGMSGPPVYGRPAGAIPLGKPAPPAPREDDIPTTARGTRGSSALDNVASVSTRETNLQSSEMEGDVDKTPNVEDGSATRDATLSVEKKSSQGKSQPLQVPRRALPPRKKSSRKLSSEAIEAESAIVGGTSAHDEAIPDPSPTEDEVHIASTTDTAGFGVEPSRATSVVAGPDPDSVDLLDRTIPSDFPAPHAAAVDNPGVAQVPASEPEVYEHEDEDGDADVGSAPALMYLEDATNPSHQPQPKVEYIEPEQHLQTATHTEPTSPVAEPVDRQPPPPPSLPPPRPAPATPLPLSDHGEDQSHVPKIPPPPPLPRMLGADSDEDDDHQSDKWDEEPSFPALRAVPQLPNLGPNTSGAIETTMHKSPEEYKPPPVNLASRPPIPQSYNRPTPNEEAPSTTKRRSTDLVPSSPVSPQEAQQPQAVNPVSTKPLRRTTLPPLPPVTAVTHNLEIEEPEGELMDEADTDPIDPSFYSPPRSVPLRTTGFHNERTVAATSEEASDRRIQRTAIAERMAKLGSIQFGAPVIPPPPVRKQTQASGTSEITNQQYEPADPAAISDEPTEETEEEIQARRALIAARLAGQGGLRFGMIPAPPSSLAKEPRDERFVDELESVPESPAASDDGVKLEAEDESEFEVAVEEATPPPVPLSPPKQTPSTRSPPAPLRPPPPLSPTGSHPPHPPSELERRPSQKRPPVPGGISLRKKSGPTPVPSPISPRFESSPSSNADYVLVDEPDTSVASSRLIPNQRSSLPLAPPSRLPSSPQPSTISPERSQWELPPIPSSTLDMGDGTHSDDDTIYPPIKATSPSTSPVQSVRASSSRHSHDGSRDFRYRVPTSDELIVLWGKVGTRVISHAEELVEASKKSVIGDGSAEGFVREVLDHVPEALQSDSEYGYLIYSQNGTSVLKRASDIMPGDVIAIQDARFKGHRGLSAYSWHVGTGDVPLVGIIHDFEGKKSKVRVFQAAMHPNSYPSVESVSYRLEDMKSGLVKIYRVAEA